MSKRKRIKRMMVNLSEEEWERVQAKMAEANAVNFSGFARKAILNAEVKHYDFSELKEFTTLLGRVAGNINQIAKRCNMTKSVHETDVENLRAEYAKLKGMLTGEIIRVLRSIQR